MEATQEARLKRARIALEGLSVGDALGDRFFMHADSALALISSRALPKAPWAYTDDTNMALSIYQVLRQHGEIKQDALAQSYAEHYDSARGYGPAMHRLLLGIQAGQDWREISKDLFSGQGSYGNGAAMRVAPLGAYFADDLSAVIEQAKLSAEITHAHPEGIVGAIAVAVATTYAWQSQETQTQPSLQALIDFVLPHLPASEVKSKIARAREISPKTAIDHVSSMIGNGYGVSAQDTVPFVLWSAGQNMSNYEDAIWKTASALGDVDTNCAMVGGIVASYVGADNIPAEWITSREPLPAWALE